MTESGELFYHHIPVGTAFSLGKSPTLYGYYHVTFRTGCFANGCFLGKVGGIIRPQNVLYTPQVSWVPNPGYAASPTWSQLSAGAKQTIFNSGALTTALKNAAMSSGPSGFLSGGSLAGQGINTGLTVFGADNTVGNVILANLSVYNRNCQWKFEGGKWLCVLNGVAYFPSNIAAATNPRSIPRWRVGANGVEEWVFPINSSGNNGGGGNNSGGGNNGGDLTNSPPPNPPPIRPNGNGVIRRIVGSVVVAGARVAINNIIKANNGSPFDQAITKALDSTNIGTQLEGHVANTLNANGFDLVNFQQRYGLNGSIGDIDVETDKAIIEVTTKRNDKLQQVGKLMTNTTMNPSGKPVILYAPRYQPNAGRAITRSGAYVVRNDQELIDLLDSL